MNTSMRLMKELAKTIQYIQYFDGEWAGRFGRDQVKTYANESWAIASWFAAQGQRTNDRVEAKADRALRSG